MNGYDRDKGIKAEGQHAAIWHAERDGRHSIGYTLPLQEAVTRQLAAHLAADQDRQVHRALIELGWTAPVDGIADDLKSAGIAFVRHYIDDHGDLVSERLAPETVRLKGNKAL
ncbi:hypothetical protein [Oricola cellulosilytica]|uniref:Uncharacterized protein n=1 Tax=Oricola cellulosilytica TaxID=1429082 RepID=A0A4R0PFJ2_9HYPH|nr:hypothetical protein [Oricola cellulosilytica]TCD15175.1 hypothetical protein E0D97_06395 [Oricola cellulosilytica]